MWPYLSILLFRIGHGGGGGVAVVKAWRTGVARKGLEEAADMRGWKEASIVADMKGWKKEADMSGW